MKKQQKGTIIIDSSPRAIDFEIEESNVVFMGVERGALKLAENRVKMALAFGDFDTTTGGELAYLKSVTNVIKVPEEKKVTDMEGAIRLALGYGFEKIYIIADISRVDHLLVNIELVKKYNVKFFSQNATISKLTKENGRVEIRKNNYKYISLFPITDKVVATTSKSLNYPLPKTMLKTDTTVFISNEIQGPVLSIAVKEGELLVVQARDPMYKDKSVY